MEIAENSSVTAPYTFRGSDFYVTMDCKGNNSVTIEVEDRLTADQWRATFDAAYVEDLTRKTGNFKQFSIFVSMLESAITQSSSTVFLDLLTYSDLEVLRQKKSGASDAKSSIPAPRSGLMSKRYLILTYTVEFDRIHYPLPLPYVGKPDPRALQETIRQLKTEIKKLKQAGYAEYRNRDYEKLQKEFQRLAKEKDEIEAEFMQYRREMRNTVSGSTVKEVRTLKAVVRNLEQELMKEKTEHQRASSKRSQEYRELLEEVEELRASERNLRVRVKSLTNELAVYKRGRQPARSNSTDKRSSIERLNKLRKNSSSRQRSLSRERNSSYSRDIERSSSHDRLYLPQRRDRSSSRDRPSSAPNRSRHSESPSSVRGSFHVSRSPSPAGLLISRFNPTAYIKEQERRKKEAVLKRKRRERANVSGVSINSKPSPASFNSSRNSAHSRHRSRTSSIGSQGDLSDGFVSDGSYTSRLQSSSYLAKPQLSQSKMTRGKARLPYKSKVLASTPENGFGKRKSVIDKENVDPASTSDGEESEVFDRSAEINEIDERLNRLQQLMKATMP
ncbi:coiled-coil domain-containing protein 61-like isoform X2 [Pomacea canaliculata]|uniref:coiled-coil domain-containing protein 61-like isoform X2 n=1 Tax=Pomacea canaliculata TaxID=400727 RepID=UPI000D7256B9|nr:coiled-coil domain-containing protein 61-like isoform X2 [Pomacea canaliculata]